MSLAVGMLIVLGLGATSLLAWWAMAGHATAEAAWEANVTTDHLLEAAGNWAVERGLTNIAVNAASPATASDRAGIGKRRAAADAAFAAGLERLAGRPELSSAIAAAENAHRAIVAIRQEVDAALGRPVHERPAGLSGRWVAAATKLIEVSQQVRGSAEYQSSGADAQLAALQRLKQSIWVVSEYAGRERAAIGGLIPAGTVMSPERLAEFTAFRSKVELAWQDAVTATARVNAPPELKDAAAVAQEAMFVQFEATRAAVYAAGRTDGAYPISAPEWVARATAAIDSVLAFGRTAGAIASRLAGDTAHHTDVAMWAAAGAFGLILLVGAAVLLVVMLQVARPLSQLATVTRRLAGGETETDIPCSGWTDELGTLAAAMGVFRQSLLDKTRLEAEQDAHRVAAEQERRAGLAALVNRFEAEVGALAHVVASAAGSLQVSATDMRDTTEQAGQQTGLAHVGSGEASGAANMVAAAAEELTASISEISHQIEQSAERTAETARAAQHADKVVRALADSASRIGTVVELINTIAGQTNLLALNATIEAARAGKAGLGFAVVANEVKALARRTAGATGEISEQVSQIQAAVRDASLSIGGMAGSVEQLTAIATAIATAIEQQGAATAEIARNAQSGAMSTQQVGAAIARVAACVADASSGSGVVLGSAVELSRRADELRHTTRHLVESVRAA